MSWREGEREREREREREGGGGGGGRGRGEIEGKRGKVQQEKGGLWSKRIGIVILLIKKVTQVHVICLLSVEKLTLTNQQSCLYYLENFLLLNLMKLAMIISEEEPRNCYSTALIKSRLSNHKFGPVSLGIASCIPLENKHNTQVYRWR